MAELNTSSDNEPVMQLSSSINFSISSFHGIYGDQLQVFILTRAQLYLFDCIAIPDTVMYLPPLWESGTPEKKKKIPL